MVIPILKYALGIFMQEMRAPLFWGKLVLIPAAAALYSAAAERGYVTPVSFWLEATIVAFLILLFLMYVLAKRAYLLELPRLKITNVLFRNNDDLTPQKTRQEINVYVRNASKGAIQGSELRLIQIVANQGNLNDIVNKIILPTGHQTSRITINPDDEIPFLLGTFIYVPNTRAEIKIGDRIYGFTTGDGYLLKFALSGETSSRLDASITFRHDGAGNLITEII